MNKMDPVADRQEIITQIINYGDKRQTEWMNKTYSAGEIKAAVFHPRRGVWFREKLRLWLGKFNLTIDPLEFDAAVIDLSNPRVKLQKEVFKRRGIL